VDVPVGIVEQTHLEFLPQDPSDRIVDKAHLHFLVRDKPGQVLDIAAAFHIHVVARFYRRFGGLIVIPYIPVIDHFTYRPPVADNKSLKSPLPFQYIPWQIPARGGSCTIKTVAQIQKGGCTPLRERVSATGY